MDPIAGPVTPGGGTSSMSAANGTIERAHLVDALEIRWYHDETRCVRRAFLLG